MSMSGSYLGELRMSEYLEDSLYFSYIMACNKVLYLPMKERGRGRTNT